MTGVDLEAVLTGVAGAREENRLRRSVGRLHVERLHLIERQVVADQTENRLHDLLGLRTLYGQLTVVVAAVVDVDVEALGVVGNPGIVLVDVGSIDGKEEAVVGKSADAGVVDGAAIGIAHHAVEHLPGRHTTEVVGEQMVDESLSVGSGDDDLTHVGDVEDTAVVAHGIVLLDDGGVLYRHVIAGEGLHESALCDMARMETGLFHIYLYNDIIIDICANIFIFRPKERNRWAAVR